jgi:dolichyl-phosphate beta-glucosyltransferase
MKTRRIATVGTGGIDLATLSLVIPAYNEEIRLPALLDVLASSADVAVERGGFELLEILIVDDGSTDRTREMLNSAATEDPRLKPVLELDEHRGKGAALAAGIDCALGEYVLLADVDLSTPLEELHKLTTAIREGADVAIGSRAIAGSVVERCPLHRRLLGKAFNGTVRALTGLAVRDTQCGFKLLRADVAKALFAEQTCPGFASDVELLMRADIAGLCIVEEPVLYVHDSRSRVRVISDGLQMLRDVSGLAYWLSMRGSAPPCQSSGRSLAALSPDDPD